MGILALPEELKFVTQGEVQLSGTATYVVGNNFGVFATKTIAHGLNYRPALLVYLTVSGQQYPVSSGTLIVEGSARMTGANYYILHRYFGIDDTNIYFKLYKDGYRGGAGSDSIDETYKYYLLKEGVI